VGGEVRPCRGGDQLRRHPHVDSLGQAISRANPFFYLISGFRFGFLGESDIGNTNHAVFGAALGVGAMNLLFAVVCYRVLKSGWKLKS
jgi:ABC-2 type transport system permease protein